MLWTCTTVYFFQYNPTLLGETLPVEQVAHLACAMHIKPHVSFICGARPCAPRICVIPVAHPNTCVTHNICGAPHLGAPRIGCATDIKNGAPLICFPFVFFSKIQQKYIVYSKKYTIYSTNAKIYTSVTQEFTEIHQYEVKCQKTSI
jgi:hypothetical protein